MQEPTVNFIHIKAVIDNVTLLCIPIVSKNFSSIDYVIAAFEV